MSKFIIADLTDAKSVVQELQAIVPDFPSVPVRFIIIKSQKEPRMFDGIRPYTWVLGGAFEYESHPGMHHVQSPKPETANRDLDNENRSWQSDRSWHGDEPGVEE
jgi:hypothetical protein